MAVGSVQTILLKGHERHALCIPGSQNQSVLGIEVTHIVCFLLFGDRVLLYISSLLGTFHVD